MFGLRPYLFTRCFKTIHLMRSLSTSKFFVEKLSKRTLLKLSGPETNDYLQSMMTNDIKNIYDLPALYSLLLNAHGRVLYDILLYKIGNNEYLVEYEKTASEYLSTHLLMYRLRKKVQIEPLNIYSVWVIHPELEQNDQSYTSNLHNLQLIINSLAKEGVTTSVIDPRTNLLGIRVVTPKDINLFTMISMSNLKFVQGNSYRTYRYQLGIGEGVIDHPPGNCLPFDTNVDFLNGVSFSKGCYIGQELTARSQFTLSVKKRLMPVVFESKDTYPQFPPECTVVNETDEKMGRLRSNLEQYGLALLKYEESLKAKHLLIKDFDLKLKVVKPSWWPDDES